MAEIGLREYIREIDEMVEQGRHEEALAHARHLLQHYPKYLAAYRLLGKAMLEMGQDDLAEDMFRRVLSGDPEDHVAWVGMSLVHDSRGDLPKAIWHMERAFELASDNEAVQGEMRRLYARRDGAEPDRVQLTQGALARLYVRGDLLSRAVEELRALLAEEPGRVDLRVALAEALWRNGQRVQAEEACLQVLDALPHCLKANLILGEIWLRSGRDEGRAHMQRAEALDPENRVAAELLGDSATFERAEVRLQRLEYVPPSSPGDRPAWMAAAGLGTRPAEERGLVTVEGAMETRIEIPSWLEGLGLGEEGEAPSVAEGEVSVPEWLVDEAPPGGPAEAVLGPQAVPEWVQEVGEVGPAPEKPLEVPSPDLSAQVGPREPTEEPPPLPEPAEAEMPEPVIPADIPDWLREMAPPGMEPTGQPPVRDDEAGIEEEVPEWLAQATRQGAEEPPVGVTPDASEVEAAPSWLEGEGLPSGDEALAWLESLAVGKEEELRAAAEAEAETRMAEIMGRVAQEAAAPAEPEEVSLPPTVPPPTAEPEEVSPVRPVPPPAPEPAPAEAEAFGWTAFGAEEVAATEAPAEEAEAPEWGPSPAPPPVEVIPEEIVPAPLVEEVPGVMEMEVTPEEPRVREGLEGLREYVRANPRDHEARLELARELWRTNLYAESLEAYSRVLRSRKFAEEIAAEMTAYLEQHPSDPEVRRVLGDAYMRDGRLEEALEVYREALENL